MSRVQFQKELSMAEFLERYGTKEQCDPALAAAHWRGGFVCPVCGVMQSRTTFRRQGRLHWQCAGGRHQCFTVAGPMGAIHGREVTGGGMASVLNGKSWAVNTLIGSVKTPLTGTTTRSSSPSMAAVAVAAAAASPRCSFASTDATTCVSCSAAFRERWSLPSGGRRAESGLLSFTAHQDAPWTAPVTLAWPSFVMPVDGHDGTIGAK